MPARIAAASPNSTNASQREEAIAQRRRLVDLWWLLEPGANDGREPRADKGELGERPALRVDVGGLLGPAPQRGAGRPLQRAAAMLGVFFRLARRELGNVAIAQHELNGEEVAHPSRAR